MEDSPATNTQNFHPVKYTVNFPDGRVETFRAVTWDTVYRVRPGADMPAQSTSAGVRERFLQLNLSNMYAYLILPDGGAVEFRAQQYYDPAYGRYWYKYHVTAINDPHGLKTSIDSEVVGQRREANNQGAPNRLAAICNFITPIAPARELPGNRIHQRRRQAQRAVLLLRTLGLAASSIMATTRGQRGINIRRSNIGGTCRCCCGLVTIRCIPDQCTKSLTRIALLTITREAIPFMARSAAKIITMEPTLVLR